MADRHRAFVLWGAVMLKNADCTLYKYNKLSGGYTRHFISGVYWRENKAGNVLKSGLQTADSTTVYIFDDAVLPETPTKDMLVKGNCLFEFTNTSAATISASMKTFRETNAFVTVMSIDNMMYGGLPHIEISAK